MAEMELGLLDQLNILTFAVGVVWAWNYFLADADFLKSGLLTCNSLARVLNIA
jgi:hypothetical protein